MSVQLVFNNAVMMSIQNHMYCNLGRGERERRAKDS
jgi:hypothetical protein